MVIAVQLLLSGLYLPPVFTKSPSAAPPPQMIISLLVQTAVWKYRLLGALVVVVGVQLSVSGLYLPPVFRGAAPLKPPQIIISPPVHTAVCACR